MASDALFSQDEPAAAHTESAPRPMTPEQRAQIRELFNELGVIDARAQFDVVKELTAVDIARVVDVSAATAQRLIEGLRRRLSKSATPRAAGGTAWDQREGDTWIDKM